MSEHHQQYPHQQPPPVPPKKRRAWPWVLLAVGVAFVVVIGSCTALVGSAVDDVSEPTGTVEPTDEPAEEPTDEPTDEETTQPAKPKKDPSDGHVIFRVWGKAPGGVDITYGNDGSNHQGGKLPFRKRIKLDEGSLYYAVTAQLQGGGDIKCSVKINGVTEKSSASGGYNICSAQINGGITGYADAIAGIPSKKTTTVTVNRVTGDIGDLLGGSGRTS